MYLVTLGKTRIWRTKSYNQGTPHDSAVNNDPIVITMYVLNNVFIRKCSITILERWLKGMYMHNST